MKVLFPFLLFVFFSKFAFPQESFHEAENLQKYWFYRERLVNDFMKVGPGKGESIPAIRRGKVGGTGSGNNCPTNDPEATLVWNADATIHLGWYIGVLATEYKLLKENSSIPQDLSRTVEELYYALRALDRLDYTAESYWRNGVSLTGDLNGFFIRDDVPADFIGDPQNPASNYDHFNSEYYTSSMVKDVSSDLACPPNFRPAEESIDQAIQMLMGLALVSKCLDENVTYNHQEILPGIETETSLVRAARNMADRIVSYMKNGGIGGSWLLYNPVTHNFVSTGGNVGDGGNAQLLSYGFAEAGCYINSSAPPIDQIPPVSCPTYHNLASKTSGFVTWHNIIQITPICNPAMGLGCEPCQEDIKALTLAAVGSSFMTCISLVTVPPGTACYSPLKFTQNITQEKMESRGIGEFNEHLPLLHSFLHDDDISVSQSVFQNLLNDAPCYGPYNLGNGNYPSFEWSSTQRLMSPERRGLVASTVCADLFTGEYNGLDYMLLYNLYRLKFSAAFPQPFNVADRLIDQSFPVDFGTGAFLGNQQFPLTLRAVNTIASTSTVYSDGDVSFRAQRSIDLLPGFVAEPGATFDASLEKFICQPTYYDLGGGSYMVGLKNSQSGNNSIPEQSKAVKSNDLLIVPNPTTGIFNLESSEISVGEVFVYNHLGQIVYEQLYAPARQIDISAQSKGIYFVKVQTSDKVYTEKVVVQ